MFKIKFWGVRGSVPTPLTGEEITRKVVSSIAELFVKGKLDVQKMAATDMGQMEAVVREMVTKNLPFHTYSTYGGNTTCVEVRFGNAIIIIDGGTGLRLLGKNLLDEVFSRRGIAVTFLMTHVHWDHIQGFPFFAPLYIPKVVAGNIFTFYGGMNWQRNIETCLMGQMDPPLFPVSFQEIEATGGKLAFNGVHDRMSFEIPDDDGGYLYCYCRKLDHPNETYGWRLEYKGKVFAFTTDNEPRDPLNPSPSLIDLARKADLWATDCQYFQNIYNGGVDRPTRHGWGHSYPKAVAETAFQAGTASVVLFHHDPESRDEDISLMADMTRQLIAKKKIGSIDKPGSVEAAFEGMEVVLEQ
jgi:phosphoribosyl 1,2-cyclic phosphodiesterase